MKMKKVIALFLALAMSAAALSACSESTDGTESESTSTVSEDTSENASSEEEVSEDASSEESSEVVSEDDTDTSAKDIGWEVKDVEAPTFEDTKFETINYKPVESSDGFEVTIATPSYVLDTEAVKEKLKSNSALSDKFKFAEGVTEKRNVNTYSDVGTLMSCYILNKFYCYTEEQFNESDDKKLLEPVTFTYTQDYSGYNSPDLYSLEFYNAGLNQDEIFSVASDIFGEKIAEYLVYNTSTEFEDGRDLLSVEIPTPDGKSTYQLTRIVRQDEYSGDYEITLQVLLMSNSEIVTSDDTKGFQYYPNDYETITMPITLKEFFPSDMGGTEADNVSSLFSKALSFSYNSEDAYQESTYMSTDDYILEYITYHDGSSFCSYEIQGYKTVTDNNPDLKSGFSFNLEAYKDADGKIQVNEMNMKLPSADTTDDSVDPNKLSDIAVDQFAYVFDVDESTITSQDSYKENKTATVEATLGGTKNEVVVNFANDNGGYFFAVVE